MNIQLPVSDGSPGGIDRQGNQGDEGLLQPRRGLTLTYRESHQPSKEEHRRNRPYPPGSHGVRPSHKRPQYYVRGGWIYRSPDRIIGPLTRYGVPVIHLVIPLEQVNSAARRGGPDRRRRRQQTPELVTEPACGGNRHNDHGNR